MMIYQLYLDVTIIVIVTLVTLVEAAPLDNLLDVTSTESDCSEWVKHGSILSKTRPQIELLPK